MQANAEKACEVCLGPSGREGTLLGPRNVSPEATSCQMDRYQKPPRQTSNSPQRDPDRLKRHDKGGLVVPKSQALGDIPAPLL